LIIYTFREIPTAMKKHLLTLFTFLSLISANAQYTITDVVTSLAYPVCYDTSNDGRYFISLKGGTGSGAPANAKINVYDSAGVTLSTFWDFTDSVETYFERGVLGIALDPDFDNNHYVYVFYNHDSPAQIRVVRFTEVANVGTNPTIILQISDPYTAGNHTGGNIHFRPTETDKLYVTIGDRATSSNSQLLTNPFGKILRINSDGTIPTDNPFYDDGNTASGNDDRIWAYGLRNSFDFTFSSYNDSLYASENGANTYDEVNQIVRGGNYGWPSCEGISGAGCSNPSFIAPMDVWPAPLPAVTGIIIYDHSLMPEFTGHMLVTDYDYGDITDFTLGGSPVYNTVTASQTIPGIGTLSGLTDISQGTEGCIYVIKGGYTPSGKIQKICPVGMGLTEPELQTAFEVAPVPANESVSIRFAIEQNSSIITLRDMTGRIILEVSFSGTQLLLNVEHIPSGVYILTVESDSGISTKQLIISR
jgi:glucose/arabinose dehydrogenase